MRAVASHGRAGISGEDCMDCSRFLLAAIVLAAPCAAQAVPDERAVDPQPAEPTWQGLTLLEWLDERVAPPRLGVAWFDPSRAPAIAALGPGSPHEQRAFDWLMARVDRTVPFLSGFGDRALPVLLEHRGKVRDEREFARLVVGAGAAGVRHALEQMRNRPAERDIWLRAFGMADASVSAHLAAELAGADATTTDEVLDCLARVPCVSGAVRAPILVFLADEERADRAVRILASLECADLRPALEELAADAHAGDDRRRSLLSDVIRRCRGDWSAAAAADPELVPLLRRCVTAGDAAAVVAAVVTLGRIGPAAGAAAADLLRLARAQDTAPGLRGRTFRALWCVAQPSPDTFDALRAVLAERPHDAGIVLEQCLDELARLGGDGVPFLRRALALESHDLQLRALDLLRRLGPPAADAAAEVETMIERDLHTLPAVRTLLTIAPERWAALAPRLLDRARAEVAAASHDRPTTDLLIRRGPPEGAVLDFFVELYRRDGDRWIRSREGQLMLRLCEGRAFEPIVDDLAAGRIDLWERHRHVVAPLCEARPPLQDAVPWLKAELRAIERSLGRPRMGGHCGTFARYPHALHARLLGAAGELDFLRALAQSEIAEVRGFGYAGIGELARHDPRAATFLIDRLIKTAQAASRAKQKAGWPQRPRTAGGPVILPVDPHIQAIVLALAQSGEATARILAGSLFGPDPVVTTSVLSALAHMGGAALVAVPEIELLLRETDDRTIAEAARVALRSLATHERGSARELPVVLRSMATADPAAGVLDPATIDRILKLLPEHAAPILAAGRRLHPNLRAWLVRAAVRAPLAGAGPPPVPLAMNRIAAQRLTSREGAPAPRPLPDVDLLVPFAADPHPAVRAVTLQAIQLLPEGTTQRVTDLLIDVAMADPHWEVRAIAMSLLRPQPGRPLRAVSPERMRALRGAFTDDDLFVREKVAQILHALERVPLTTIERRWNDRR